MLYCEPGDYIPDDAAEMFGLKEGADVPSRVKAAEKSANKALKRSANK